MNHRRTVTRFESTKRPPHHATLIASARQIFFISLLVVAATSGVSSAQSTSDEAVTAPVINPGIGYPSIAAAISALKKKPGVKFSFENSDKWTIVREPDNTVVWSFTPPTHYAYPSVIKREVVERDGNKFRETRALCQAAKAACDRLLSEFNLTGTRAPAPGD